MTADALHSPTMLLLFLAVGAFVGLHIALSAPGLRPRAVAALGGESRFTGVYAALAGLALIAAILAFARAPFVPLWDLGAAGRGVAKLLMLPACLFLVCGLSQPNPTAVGQGFASGAADPAPGILKLTRHPVMWAFGLWAIGHLLANGELAALILFGGVGLLALYGTTRLDAKRRARDPDGFARFAAVTSNPPLGAILGGRQRLGAALAEIGWKRIGGAALLYAALWLAHPHFAGRALG